MMRRWEGASIIIFYRFAAARLLKEGKPDKALDYLQAAHETNIQFDAQTRELERKIYSLLSQKK
jgi:hypothetical protein